MVSRLAAWWCWCPAGCGAGGSQTQAQCETTPANCEGAAARRSGPWLHDGFMDITSGGHGDRGNVHKSVVKPWTLPRVATVIERLTGVHYHPGHVWKILGAIDWSLQRPAKQARERDPEKVKFWLTKKWPAVKKTLVDEKPRFSLKTKAESRSAPRSREPGRRKAKHRS